MPRIYYERLAKQGIEKLINYAVDYLYLDQWDIPYVRNLMMQALKLDAPYNKADVKKYDFYEVLGNISAYAVRKRLVSPGERLNFEAKMVGIVMPSPSKVVGMFDSVASSSGTKAATDMLYHLSEDCGYLRRPDLDKNIVWQHCAERGDITVTINLAKPEKTPEQVRLAKLASGGYPKCMLCLENIGYAGNAVKPARQNLRTIPFVLDKERWFMQFSPYQYFDQHIIVISEEHRPMKVDDATFRRLLDFVEVFPHYFLGSNASLPIVGGSILAHEHYQGGNKVLPLFKRGKRKQFQPFMYPELTVSIVDWYNSVVRLESKNKAQILQAAYRILAAWENYSDESVGILCKTNNGEEDVQHNAITPIASINDKGEYQLDLILRNNRTDAEHPYGIFHPAKELHNIKQEAIGIIEVMGQFILPGRLASECKQIRDILMGVTKFDASFNNEDHPLYKHFDMIVQLMASHGVSCSQEEADAAIEGYINSACEKILDTTAVFKNDEKGQAAFEKFIKSLASGMSV